MRFYQVILGDIAVVFGVDMIHGTASVAMPGSCPYSGCPIDGYGVFLDAVPTRCLCVGVFMSCAIP